MKSLVLVKFLVRFEIQVSIVRIDLSRILHLNFRRALARPHRSQDSLQLALILRTVIRTLRTVQENQSELPLTITTSWICTNVTISTQLSTHTILTNKLLSSCT